MKNDNQSSVFIDSSFFKANIDPKDDFYEEAQQIMQKLHKEDAELVTSNYVLDETFTLIKIKCGLKFVSEFRNYLVKSATSIKVIRVTISDEATAWQWFLLDWSKLSFTDCVSFSLMKRLDITRVVTFDNHFERAGFKIEH